MTDRKVTLALSKDGGHTFADPREATVGDVGQYRNRVRFRRFGVGRELVARVRFTSPVRCDVNFLVVDAEAGE